MTTAVKPQRPIQMVDLALQYHHLQHEIDEEIKKVLQSAAFINGPAVQEFKKNLEAFLGVRNVIPCANGTDALQIAMMGLGLKPGDEVITADFTYVATAEVIGLLGLTPVLVDVDPDTFTIDIEQVKKNITPKTKAIVPVHLYGQCSDMEPLMKIAKEFGLFVIEDVAQAIGAEYLFSNGKREKAGNIGHVGCTSFFPSKNLGCYGDGGAMYTNDDELAAKLKMISHHGQSRQYVHDVLGVNSRLDSLQAAILNVKLKYLSEFNQKRKEAADRYDALLKGVKEITCPKRFEKSTHVFHQYTLRLDEKISRDEMKKYLLEQGIPTMIYYPIPLHKQNAFKSERYANAEFPVTEKLCRTVLSLPIYPEITSEVQEYVAYHIKHFISRYAS
ncbi:MAG: DegT/DnrJ/EryC1/StrS family aminotransferase [Bacteroidia bacterium]|nr:DegT/DnrJ/EryC1/StrS family aminotransferase [Bacteroidia bacterium]